MENNIEVRFARSDDKSAVVAFCQNTFSWGDYIAEVFDVWANELDGKLLVALIDQQPVGILHVLFMENAVAWLEGMRVHPDFRRQKIGTILDSAARDIARENKCRVAHLVTSTKNIAAQKTLDTEGYYRVAQFNEWETEPAAEPLPKLEIATAENIPAILAIWHDSPIRQASHEVVPNRHWHWKTINQARLEKHLTANELRITQNGFAIVTVTEEQDWSGLTIYALVGNEPGLFEMARAVRGEAASHGYSRIEASVAECAPLNQAMTRAGYRTDGGLYLYEQVL